MNMRALIPNNDSMRFPLEVIILKIDYAGKRAYIKRAYAARGSRFAWWEDMSWVFLDTSTTGE